MPQFTITFRDGTVLDLTPHLPRLGKTAVFDSPSKHERDIVRRVMPEKLAEFDEIKEQRRRRVERLDQLIRAPRNFPPQ